MMIFRILSIILFVASCTGAPTSVPQPDSTVTDSGETPKTQPTNTDESITIDPDNTDVGEVKMLLAGKSLPTCETKIAGATYYLITEEVFKYCDEKSWKVVNLKGENGEAGAQGAVGPQGPQGVAGATGAQGPQGTAGVQGPQGAQGSQGSQGSQGIAGTNGSNGKNSLIVTSDESAGANCANGGKKIETGIDADNSGTLTGGEVAATSYVCNGSNTFLKVYNSSGTALGYYVSQNIVNSEAYSSLAHGFIMKHLTQDIYTFYRIYSETNITTYDIQRVPLQCTSGTGQSTWCQLWYESNDCTGQAYYMNEDSSRFHISKHFIPLLMIKGMRIKYYGSSGEISFNHPLTIQASNLNLNSRLDSSGVCQAETVLDGNLVPVTYYSTPSFSNTISDGWYIAP